MDLLYIYRYLIHRDPTDLWLFGYDWKRDIVHMLVTEVQIVQTAKHFFAPILRMVVTKDAASLGVSARYLKDQFATALYDYVRWPYFNVDIIDSLRLYILDVRATVPSVR